MPITRGEGAPALASCARMYCFSRSLTCASPAPARAPHPAPKPGCSAVRHPSQTAPCSADCRPGSRAAPASPRHNAGSPRVVSRAPEQPGIRRSPDRARTGADCRTSPDRPDRSCRNGFFERRSRLTISVPASPSTSRIVVRGRKPGCLYASVKRRFGFARSPMPKRARFLRSAEQRKTQYPQASGPL